ncbi:MAG: hypothetical protein ACREKE_03170, partial [bacterium]
MDSARAFGSLAAAPNGAKLLLDFRLNLSEEKGPSGRTKVLFPPDSVRSQDGPLWAVNGALQDGLEAQAVTLFAGQDAVLAVLNLRNRGTKSLDLHLDLSVDRGGQGLSGTAERSARYPALWLTLDRSQAVGRELVEYAGLWLGGPTWTASLGAKPLLAGQTRVLDREGLDARLAWPHSRHLLPGQSLRLPLLLVWGDHLGAVQYAAEQAWRRSALPPGRAYALARRRWASLLAPLPRLPIRETLLKKAVLSLWHSDYGREAALDADQFSAEKGRRDAFFSVDSPLAALGWSELDYAKAEGAVLDLASAAASGPGAVPPYSGDEKLSWDAAGLPLNALAAWELFQRDPDTARAQRFLATYGPRLRQECAWWPSNRGGAGDGLYAYALPEEKPAYLGMETGGLFGTQAPGLNSWSLALSSLVAWQMQLGAALAQA